MYYFDRDYLVGAHPEVMEKLVETNMLHTVGYQRDGFCDEARKRILEACGLSDGKVLFFVGGTQTNATVIDGLLRRHEGVLAADTSHINVHEAGAIEASGHKVLTLPAKAGKIDASQIDEYVSTFYSDDTYSHMVAPGMVYISFPTELGTLYTCDELVAISNACHKHNIPLYVDGARLAYGLKAPGNDISLEKLAAIADYFYIGGTKCGALMGEALVTRHVDAVSYLYTLIKQHGAMLAKGRLLGVQFLALFSNDLYGRIGCHAIEMAMRLKAGMKAKNVELMIDSPTNQQFFVLPNETIARLRDIASFGYWGAPGDEKSAVRFVTDWSTTPEAVDAVIAAI